MEFSWCQLGCFICEMNPYYLYIIYTSFLEEFVKRLHPKDKLEIFTGIHGVAFYLMLNYMATA